MKGYLLVLLIGINISQCLYSRNSKVVDLSPSNFDQLVLKSKEVWFVEFYAPWCGHCKSLAPEYEKLAQAGEGIVRVGAMDLDKHQSFGSNYGIRGFPTIKLFGDDKKKPMDYNGQRTARDMVGFAIDKIRSTMQQRLSGGRQQQQQQQQQQQGGGQQSDVVELSDDDIDKKVIGSNESWIIQFYAPWCGHCKKLGPEYNTLPGKLSGEVKVGKVDATVHQKYASSYGVQGYPTIIFVPPQKDNKGKHVNYEGNRDGDSIASWAKEQNQQYMKSKMEQLLGEQQFASNCRESKGICLLVILPHILDSSKKERDGYLNVLQKVADQYKSRPVWFLWTQAGDFYSMEERLNLGSGYPTIVAVSFSKKMYSVMRGAFQLNIFEQFMIAVLSGRERFSPMGEIEKIGSGKAWDGKDAEVSSEDKEDL